MDMVAKEMQKTQPASSVVTQQKAEDFLYQTVWLATEAIKKANVSVTEQTLSLKASVQRGSISRDADLQTLLSTHLPNNAGLQFTPTSTRSKAVEVMR